MTKTKIERLRKELIEKHGDVVLLEMINTTTKVVESTIALSAANITCTADMKDVLKIVKSGKPRQVFV